MLPVKRRRLGQKVMRMERQKLLTWLLKETRWLRGVLLLDKQEVCREEGRLVDLLVEQLRLLICHLCLWWLLKQVMGRGQRWVKMGLRVETRLCTWYCQKMRRERMNRRDSGKWNVVESVSLLEEVF